MTTSEQPTTVGAAIDIQTAAAAVPTPIGAASRAAASVQAVDASFADFDIRRETVAALAERGIVNPFPNQAMTLPVKHAVPKLVAAAIKAHRIDPRLHRVLAEQIPRVGRLEKAGTFNRDYYALFKTYLASRRQELRVADLDLAAFVCVTTIEALTHTAVLHHKMVSGEEMEALIEEASRLVVGYLLG